MPSFDLNPAFKNFNVTAVWKPTVMRGPREDELIELVHRARCGDTDAQWKIADTMYCTLSRETFDLFQHLHGPVGISYREWFFEKLTFFLWTLPYDVVSATRFKDDKFEYIQADLPLEEGFHIISSWGEVVQPEDIESALRPEDNDCGMWFELVAAVSGAADNRFDVLLGWLRGHGKASPSSERRRRGWKKNQKRDSIIASGLLGGRHRGAICGDLDANHIPFLPALVALGLASWVAGWADDKGRQVIQQLFAKTRAKL